MTVAIKIDQQAISPEALTPMLAGYQMLPQLCREAIVDRAIADVECTAQECEQARKQFLEQNKISDPQRQEQWLKHFGMTPEQLEMLAVRAMKVEKFKQDTWSSKVEAYFLQRKTKLDQAVYSLIRTRNADIATEIYFRIQNQEATFADLAQEYSEGAEAQTGGIVGPVHLSTPHERIAQMLAASQPNQLWPPTRIGEWNIIVRLEKLLPAQLDDAMRSRLLNEMFRTWLEEQVAKRVEFVAATGEAEAPAGVEVEATSDESLTV